MINLSGRQLGSYQVLERIALGGMSAVYLARQPLTDREVAIKVLPVLASDAVQIARFEREAKVLAGLQHPHILSVFDFGREGDMLYFVTPVVRHGDLADYLARWGEALPLSDVRRIMRQLLDALAYAHEAGVVHRDLKPGNVLLDERGDCLVSDFGIVKLDGAAGLTQIGTVIGTPEYMSPEQGTGQPVDARSDLYSLGVILYELCTGRVPFKAESPTDLILKHRSEPVPAPRSINPQLPIALEQVILKALAKRPEDRYASAADMGEAIRQALPDTPTGRFAVIPTSRSASATTREMLTAPAASAKPTVETPVVRRPRIGILAAVLAAALAGVTIWQMRIGDEHSPRSTPPLTPNTAPVPATGAAPIVAAKPAFDAFDDPRFDGGYDPARWRETAPNQGKLFRQQGGALRVEARGREQGGIYAEIRPASEPGQWRRVSARIRLQTPVTADAATLGFKLTRDDRPGWWVACHVSGSRAATTVTPICVDSDKTVRYGVAEAPGRYLELSLSPQTGTQRLRLEADGEPLGDLALPDSAAAPGTRWYVTLTGSSDDGAPVAGEIDDVRIE